MPGHDIGFLGGDYVGVACRGVGNYKTNKLILRTDDEWAESFCEVIDKFVIMGDPIEGASMWIYKLDDPNYCLSGSCIDVLTGSNTSMSGKNLAVVHEYQYDDGWNIVSVLHCNLQDLDSGRLIISDYSDGSRFKYMEYIDPGLVSVEMENGQIWLFDIYTERWLLKSNGKIKSHIIGGNRKDVDDKYLVITLENGQKYLFDPYDRVITQLKENFGVRDYNILKSTKSTLPKSVTSGYDRVSPMYN
jgi:hypothetical protein